MEGVGGWRGWAGGGGGRVEGVGGWRGWAGGGGGRVEGVGGWVGSRRRVTPSNWTDLVPSMHGSHCLSRDFTRLAKPCLEKQTSQLSPLMQQ